MIDFGELEDEQILVATARRFGDEHLRPAERKHEHDRSYPEQLRQTYDALGFSRMALHESAGGMNLPLAVQVRVWSTLAAADPAAPIGLDPWTIAAPFLWASPQGSEFLSAHATGVTIVGRNLQLDGDVATQSIAWCPATNPSWAILSNGSSCLLVAQPRYVPLEHRPCGLQACGGVELHIDRASCIHIGGPHEAQALVTRARLFAASLALGAARDAYEYAVRYAQSRVAFGKPLVQHQSLAFLLADCAAELDASELLLQASATDAHPVNVANAYILTMHTAQSVAERTVQVLGGHGYLYDHPVEKRMRDIRTLASLFGGTTEAMFDAGQQLLDLPDILELSQ